MRLSQLIEITTAIMKTHGDMDVAAIASGNKTVFNEIEIVEPVCFGKEKRLQLILSNDIHAKTKNLINEVERLSRNTPNGVIRDADTILVDLIEKNDFEFSGFAEDVFSIWKISSDKQTIEQLFYEFTGTEFDEYLKICQKEITK